MIKDKRVVTKEMMVDYYFDVLTDYNINQDIACKKITETLI